MVTIKKISRRKICDYENIVDIDGLYTFLKGNKDKIISLEPLKQLKKIGNILTTKHKITILSLDTFIGLIKEIYGVKRYKHKFYNLIFLLIALEKFTREEFLFLSYNEKLINRVLTTKSNKVIRPQLIKS